MDQILEWLQSDGYREFIKAHGIEIVIGLIAWSAAKTLQNIERSLKQSEHYLSMIVDRLHGWDDRS